MKINELISRLQKIAAEHGDLRCVTPGFDESGADEIETVQLVSIRPSPFAGGHSGDYEIVQGEGEKALLINF